MCDIVSFLAQYIFIMQSLAIFFTLFVSIPSFFCIIYISWLVTYSHPDLQSVISFRRPQFVCKEHNLPAFRYFRFYRYLLFVWFLKVAVQSSQFRPRSKIDDFLAFFITSTPTMISYLSLIYRRLLVLVDLMIDSHQRLILTLVTIQSICRNRLKNAKVVVKTLCHTYCLIVF